MDAIKRKCLEAAGWRVGDVAHFLELSPQEVAFIEMKLSLKSKKEAMVASLHTLRQEWDE